MFESKPITIEQKGALISLMHDQSMRETLADILSEVGTTSRLIQNYECLKMVADIIRFVLTLFVHEQFSDFRLLYTILDSSSLIYYLGPKKRKIYLH